MTLEEFDQILFRFFRIQLERQNQLNQYYRVHNFELRLKKKKFRDTWKNLQEFESKEGYELISDKNYEVSVTQANRFLPIRYGEIEKYDVANEIKYSLGRPSNEYLLLFIKNLSDLAEINYRIFYGQSRNRLRGVLTHEKDKSRDLFYLLKKIIPNLRTLKISTESEKSILDFESLSSSFLFTLGYNTDASFLPSNVTEQFKRAVRLGRLRRAEIEEVEVPKRKYLQDLVLYYQKGISSDSADLQYLSFYHILEHFFEKIYDEEMMASIKNKLTSPSFSYKRNQDLKSLVKIIQDKLRYKNEEFQISEPEALKLVLDKFISDFSEVKEEINGYDTDLLNYYKSHEISFSKGNKVNFDGDRESILNNLRARIYKTRNSIVHSKETEKLKYLPYKHDQELGKEIILMRIISEHVIIGSSKSI